jgi:hypothetical protein
MTAQAGDEVKLTYTWKGEPSEHPVNGDVLKTPSGRRYLILCARGRRIEGGDTVSGAKYGQWGVVTKLLGPMRLEVLVMEKGQRRPKGSRVFPFKWNKRGKKK